MPVQPPEAVQRIQQADLMGPLQLLEAYAEQRDLDEAALSCAKAVLQVPLRSLPAALQSCTRDEGSSS